MVNHGRNLEKEQFWRLVLEEHGKSGLSAREFCRRESISEPSFYSWRRKLQQRDASSNGSSRRVCKTPALVEVMPRANHVSGIEIETPSGMKIRFDQQLDAGQLSAILSVIQGHHNQGDAPC